MIQRKQEQCLGKKIKAAQRRAHPRGLDATSACHLPDFCDWAWHGDLAAVVRPWDLGSLVTVVPSYWVQKAEVSLQPPGVAKPGLQGGLGEHCAEVAVLPTLGTCMLL